MRFPDCPYCGSQAFTPGGGHYGGSLSQTSATCGGCGTQVSLLSQGREAIATFFPTGVLEDGAAPESYHTWANQVLLPTWRHHQEALRVHASFEWFAWLKEVFYAKFPELYGRDKFTDHTISFHDCPPEAQEFVNAQWGDSTPPKVGSYVPLPENLRIPVYPPKAPNFVMFFHNREQGWDPVDIAVSANMDPPEDPILRKNRELFNEVFTAVESRVHQNIERRHVPNQYGGIEPWFQFELEDCTFTVGCRKRVIAIHVETVKGIPTEGIRELALVQDKTTYQAFSAPRLQTASELEALLRAEGLGEDLLKSTLANNTKNHPDGEIVREGGWQDTREVAYKLEVHAWDKGKLIEYLVVLCRTAIQAAAV